jgi:hypothetical protein
MKLPFSPPAAVFSMFISLTIIDSFVPPAKPILDPLPVTKKVNSSPKIQAAILLDVSNSMDGLIEQAKAQLWNMVTVMGKAKCDGVTPQIEIALYEYGRDNNDVNKGYIKQISPFSTDLDMLSQHLFKLTTFGGSEYCGQVIHASLDELNWDTSSQNYKVIFISGNEDFLQGKVSYTLACAEAKKKGVTVNTIYCGDRVQGIREHWNLGAECGNGSFSNINSDAKIEDIPTPYDTTLIVLNTRLNKTYIYYGADGKQREKLQYQMDVANAGISTTVAAKRSAVKGDKNLYYNGSWDLVDASSTNKDLIAKVDMKTLPDSLQKKTRAELQQAVEEKSKERTEIQKEILATNAKRESYIVSERAKRANAANTATLETEVEKIIKEQAKRYNMVIQ